MAETHTDAPHSPAPTHIVDGHSPDPAEKPSSTTLVDTRLFAIFEKIVVDIPRAMLVLSYLGVVAMLASFIAYDLWQSVVFCRDIWHSDIEEATIGLLSGLDGIMIANGVYLVLGGSYIVYVKDKLDDVTFVSHGQRPQALRHLSPGSLKEKMAAALVGVSSVNLLTILINVGFGVFGHAEIDWRTFTVKVGIHVVLLAGLLIFAKVNKMEAEEHAVEHGPLHSVPAGHGEGHGAQAA